MQLIEWGRTKKQIRENLTIKGEGNKNNSFLSPNKRAHTGWEEEEEGEKEERGVKQRYRIVWKF